MTDNVTAEGKNIKNADPYNVSSTEKRYQNVTVPLDPRIHRALKIMSVDESSTISGLAGEAISCWIKWMRKAELREAVKENADKEKLKVANERMEEARKLLAYAQAKKDERKRKKREIKHDKMMQKRYPYLDWKRAKNLLPYSKRDHNVSKTDNVS
ncbi:MAG: hypothetical protein WC294_00230 [Methanoregula sp.]|jgi:hypothetical protein